MLTRDQFNAKFQGRMLVFLTEAWTARKATPSELGLLMDNHARQLRLLLGEMYEALAPVPVPPANGQPAATAAQPNKVKT